MQAQSGEAMDSQEVATGDLAANLANQLESASPGSFAVTIEKAVSSLEGVDDVVVWIVDYGFSVLFDLAGRLEPVPVEGTLTGRALLSGHGFTQQDVSYVPIGRSAQMIGVLEVTGSSVPIVESLQPAAAVVANALDAAMEHSDVVQRVRGANSLGLAATIQYESLPYPTFISDGVEVAGKIEPAYDIAGDVFDYAVNPEGAHVAIFDAVGHGLRSTMLSSLAIGSYRQQRRQGSSLPEMAIAIDRVVAANAAYGEFVTGLLLAIRPDQKVVEIWNGGHLPPLMVRDLNTQVIDTGPALLPFGLGPEHAPQVVLPLQPSDQLFLFTDGVVQAQNETAQFWGSEALADMVSGRVDETKSMFLVCRQILDAIRQFVGGPLKDDATMVAVRWKG